MNFQIHSHTLITYDHPEYIGQNILKIKNSFNELCGLANLVYTSYGRYGILPGH